MKKILLIIGVLILIAVVGYFGWRYFQSFLNQEEFLPPPPTTFESPFQLMVNREVFSYWKNNETDELYYLSTDGDMYSQDTSGTETKISEQTISDFYATSITLNANKLLVAFGTPYDSYFSVFDTESQTWEVLFNPDITAAALSPNGLERAYFESPDTLVLEDEAGDTTILTAFHQKDVLIEWLLPDALYISQRPSAQVRSSLWKLTLSDKTLIPLAINQLGLSTQWSSDGVRGLQFSHDDKKNNLILIDENNQIQAILPFTTLPSKCLIEEVMIYCGVPENITPRTELPDDYLKQKFLSQDALIAWNTDTGEITRFLEGNQFPVDIIQLSRNANVLLFVNRYDNKLYSFPLN